MEYSRPKTNLSGFVFAKLSLTIRYTTLHRIIHINEWLDVVLIGTLQNEKNRNTNYLFANGNGRLYYGMMPCVVAWWYEETLCSTVRTNVSQYGIILCNVRIF